MNHLRDKVTGRFKQAAQDQCAMAPREEAVQEPGLIAAARRVTSLQLELTATQSEMSAFEELYEKLLKQQDETLRKLEDARAELHRLS